MTCSSVGADLTGGGTNQHPVAFERAYSVATETAAILEHVVGDVVGVGPYTHLGIVVEIPVEGIRVTVVAAGGIGTGRNGNTLRVGSCGNGKLRKYPAVGQLVILNNRITIII